MYEGQRVAVIIPAFNEAASIARVIEAVPAWVDAIIVCDNGSTDGTGNLAVAAGATVVHEERAGYGAACLKAIEHLGDPEIVVFLDGDFSDYPEEMDRLVDPIARNEADLVIGSRSLGAVERGALTPQQRCGNALACFLIRVIWGHGYTDLGPFRAIRYAALMELEMADRTWGWTVEMQVKALQQGLRVREVAAGYRKRIGKSKISGTLSGVIKAGTKILYTIARLAVVRVPEEPPTQRVIMFTRYPETGKVKTRLIPALGRDGAKAIHSKMAQHAALVIRRAEDRRTTAEVRFTGSNIPAMRAWLGPDLHYAPQCEGDLGQRMFGAIDDAMPEAERVVVVGTDCPALNEDHIRQAFALLRNHDLVIGPAADGGYYLIGMHYPLEELFEGVEWGTETVFEKTRTKAERLGLRVGLLQTLPDVDTPEDLVHWEAYDLENVSDPPRLSVIIPAVNEQAHIAKAIAGVRRCPGVEIVVSDGCSEDSTARIAETYGARVLHGERGRAVQMNAGAWQCRSPFLLFLHADCVAPPRYADTVLELLRDKKTAAGAFRLRINGPGAVLRIAERVANFRSAWRQLPYGDQALFVREEVFRAEGGYKPIPIMEDFDLMQRLRRRGAVVLADDSVLTSERRWRETGPFRLTFRHQCIVLGWLLGVSPERLVRWR